MLIYTWLYEVALFVKVNQPIFIRGRPTCDNRMIVHQTKQLPRAFVRACACAYVRICTVSARGRLELMMTTTTYMRDVLHTEAIL